MKLYNKFIFGFILLLGFSSCELDQIENTNAPTRESLIEGASQSDLQFLTSGLESVMRSDMEYYYWTVSTLGREYYDLRATDPRYTGELLGRNGSDLDNNGFLTTRPFAQVYRVARQANDLIESVENSSTSLSAEQLESIKGIANTYKAYSLSLELNRQYENGIRLDVNDADNLGAFLSYEESLAGIRTLLEKAKSQVQGADTFPVELKLIGFNEYDNTLGTSEEEQILDTFVEFQNSLLARIAIYQNDKQSALSFLQGSLLDLNGNLDGGIYFPFGESGNDVANPLYYGSSPYMAHPSFADEAETGDVRVDEKTMLYRDSDGNLATISTDGISSNRIVTLYDSNVSPVPLIRNEELILIYAEANIGNNNLEALNALNMIRMSAGLNSVNYSSDADLVDELLMQRRYSLFGEGHRWVDLRRYNRLDTLPLDRPGDVIHAQFPRPQSEG